MLSFTGSLRVLVALEPGDMRAGFNTRQGLVAEKLKENVRSRALFVFSNRRHTRLKVLYWTGAAFDFCQNGWRPVRFRGRARRRRERSSCTLRRRRSRF